LIVLGVAQLATMLCRPWQTTIVRLVHVCWTVVKERFVENQFGSGCVTPVSVATSFS